VQGRRQERPTSERGDSALPVRSIHNDTRPLQPAPVITADDACGDAVGQPAVVGMHDGYESRHMRSGQREERHGLRCTRSGLIISLSTTRRHQAPAGFTFAEYRRLLERGALGSISVWHPVAARIKATSRGCGCCYEPSMRALVSVVVPTHNRARLLTRTLHSILAQRIDTIEVIVSDDGSADDTERIAATLDRRIRVVRNHEPAGVSAARNRGIAEARGEWIAFCDDDDLWAPDKLSRQVMAAEQSGADWAYTGDVNVDQTLRVLSGGPPPDPDRVLELLPHWNPLSSGGSNVIVRSARLATIGGFDVALRRTEDWDMWIRLARIGRPACVNAPLVAYRFHRGNVAADPADMVDEARQLAARYKIPVDIAAMHRRAAWAGMRGGDRLVALRHYARAVAHGDLRSIGRGAYALMHPAVGNDRLFALLGRDAAWVAEAERWLAALAPAAPDRSEM
jgi:GT2 family glycosyltransferase